MSDYEREINQLAAEMMHDDPDITHDQARKMAREQMTELYRLALDWNQHAAAMRSTPTRAA